jgi:hypothetical protein
LEHELRVPRPEEAWRVLDALFEGLGNHDAIAELRLALIQRAKQAGAGPAKQWFDAIEALSRLQDACPRQ